MKPWIKTQITTKVEQVINLQPTPNMDGIELFFHNIDKSDNSGILYIVKEDFPYIIEKMQEMMNYIKQ